MKVITVSMSNRCLQDPPCSFCFQTQKQDRESPCTIRRAVEVALDKWKEEEDITICGEYSGYNLSWTEKTFYFRRGRYDRPPIHYTLTTMPSIITTPLATYLGKNTDVEAVALSYDSQKLPHYLYWVKKAQMLRQAQLKVSCNFLLENPDNPLVPIEVVNASDQINLLSLKPTGQLTPTQLTKINLLIETLKGFHIPVTVDNCLGVQLGFIAKCKRGEDFIHITPGGVEETCCFKEKCFLYN